MQLNTNITLAYINYKYLDTNTLNKLNSAKIAKQINEDNALKHFGIEARSISFIEKCNAIIILVIHDELYSQEFLRGRILSFWDKFSKSGITSFINDVQFKFNLDALVFLAEASLGIHSVTIGDSQVMAQITSGLNSGMLDVRTLEIISNWIHDLSKDVRLKTKLFDGNISIERIAAELIVNKLTNKNSISDTSNVKGLILGYGQSGKLVAKILNKENNIPLYIINRTHINVSDTELNESDVEYKPLDKINTIKDIDFCVVTLENNKDTKKLVKRFVEHLKLHVKRSVLFVDISTPPLLDNIVQDFIDIKYISNIANRNIQTRMQEVNKARNLVNKQIKSVVSAINKHIGKQYIYAQKNVNLSLDKSKLNLVVNRNKILKLIREYLDKKDFIEVTTPFIVGLLTDPAKVDKGGAIEVKLREGVPSFLRQSNQLYKQILIVSGLDKIYEIGPFWRKETSDSYRHLFETMGLDIEMRNPKNLSVLYKMVLSIVKYVFENIPSKTNLIIPNVNKVPVITYKEAIMLLKNNGENVVCGDDLGLVGEMNLSKIIFKKYKTDIFVIKNYPDTIKKFYTKTREKGLTETFDVILGGWEIASGAIRQTDGEQIRRSMLISGINPSDYEFYISVVDGAVEHGGFGLGVDRLVAKVLNLDMVHDAVLFPRTHNKLIP